VTDGRTLHIVANAGGACGVAEADKSYTLIQARNPAVASRGFPCSQRADQLMRKTVGFRIGLTMSGLPVADSHPAASRQCRRGFRVCVSLPG